MKRALATGSAGLIGWYVRALDVSKACTGRAVPVDANGLEGSDFALHMMAAQPTIKPCGNQLLLSFSL